VCEGIKIITSLQGFIYLNIPILYPPPQIPVGFRRTPPDSSGFLRTPELFWEECMQIPATPQDSAGIHRIPQDSTGLTCYIDHHYAFYIIYLLLSSFVGSI